MSENGSVNHLEKLNILFRLMEKFVRGKGTQEDAQVVINIGENLFDWTLNDACVESASTMEEKVREDFSSIAIKLHNKTRSLPPQDCMIEGGERYAALQIPSALCEGIIDDNPTSESWGRRAEELDDGKGGELQQDKVSPFVFFIVVHVELSPVALQVDSNICPIPCQISF